MCCTHHQVAAVTCIYACPKTHMLFFFVTKQHVLSNRVSDGPHGITSRSGAWPTSTRLHWCSSQNARRWGYSVTFRLMFHTTIRGRGGAYVPSAGSQRGGLGIPTSWLTYSHAHIEAHAVGPERCSRCRRTRNRHCNLNHSFLSRQKTMLRLLQVSHTCSFSFPRATNQSSSFVPGIWVRLERWQSQPNRLSTDL